MDEPNREPGARDHWTTESYTTYASFVPALTSKVLRLLDPQPNDTILDIGCGDGSLTAQIAAVCTSDHVIGLDNSPSFIASATKTVKSQYRNTDFIVADCRRVSSAACTTKNVEVENVLQEQKYDKIFSNAAMHWILRDETTREEFFKDVKGLLKPGGRFVFEMGGFGNVVEMRTAFVAVLSCKYGVSLERIRTGGNTGSGPGDPWFFPSTEWMRRVLEDAGLMVEVLESEYRPTKVGKGGSEKEVGKSADTAFEGYVRLMGARLLDLVEAGNRDEVLKDVCEVLRDATTRVEDGSRWLGFVRLRAVAGRPA